MKGVGKEAVVSRVVVAESGGGFGGRSGGTEEVGRRSL